MFYATNPFDTATLEMCDILRKNSPLKFEIISIPSPPLRNNDVIELFKNKEISTHEAIKRRHNADKRLGRNANFLSDDKIDDLHVSNFLIHLVRTCECVQILIILLPIVPPFLHKCL